MPSPSYAAWLRWRFDLRWCYDQPVAPANRRMTVWDLLLSVWRLRTGSVEIEHDGGRLVAAAGDWVLMPPGLRRRHRFSDDAAILSLRFAITDAAGLPAGLGCAPLRAADLPELTAACEAVQRACGAGTTKQQPWRGAPLAPPRWAALQATVLAAGAAALEAIGAGAGGSAGDPRVGLAQAELSRRISPEALPWRRLREVTGLSRAQIDRLFTERLGTSVRGWTEARLLAAATAALEDPAEPVKAVAARLGFGDASHFCRWFRRHTGFAPKAWRRAPPP